MQNQGGLLKFYSDFKGSVVDPIYYSVSDNKTDGVIKEYWVDYNGTDNDSSAWSCWDIGLQKYKLRQM